jgi:hypothetical protein
MRFDSEKSVSAHILFIGLPLVILGSTYLALTDQNIFWAVKVVVLFCSLLVNSFFLWSWFDTCYIIDGEVLKYRSGPLKGGIKIDEIRKVEVNKTLYSGIKPALGPNGIIIYFGKFDEIYFSPKEKEKFVALLQSVNPAIQVMGFAKNS